MPFTKLFKRNPTRLQYVILRVYGCLHTVITLPLSQYWIWRVRSAGILRRVDRWISTDVSEAQSAPILGGQAVHPEEVGTPMFRNVRQYLPVNTAFHPRRRRIFNNVAARTYYPPFAHPNTRYIYGSLRHSNGRESETYIRMSLQRLIPRLRT